MTAYVPSAFTRPIAHAADAVRQSVGSVAWGPALAVARPAILSLFGAIETGTLILQDEPAGARYVFGQKLGPRKDQDWDGLTVTRSATMIPRVELVVKKDAFWMRLFLFADMGFAESYMLGELECQDLTSFFLLFIRNREQMGNASTWTSRISATVSHLARRTNTLSNALLNVSAHYDISNDMFAAFLSPDMTYSCPIWTLEGDGNVDTEDSLEKAQMRKIHRIIDHARIKDTDHVLEIGTGWGSFAIEAVKTTGCRITSLTLSKEQKALAESRIAAAGLSDRIEVILRDYRALQNPGQPFDKLVSIEMIEAVGQEFLGTYFACVDRLLKKDGGIAVFQCITMPEGRHEAYSRSEDFINHYIFPSGYLPSITRLLDHISVASNGTLIVENVENIGGHYSKTLRLWRENFLQNFESEIRPALKREHQTMTDEECDVFCRKWEYYFTYCEAGFVSKTLGDVIITVGREGALELMEGIPI